MLNFCSFLLVAVLSGSLATIQYDSHGIKTEYYDLISDQRLEVSYFVTNAGKKISNESNEFVKEMESFAADVDAALKEFGSMSELRKLVRDHFQDYLSKIVREPRKIADAIFDIETNWKKHVEEHLEAAVDTLVMDERLTVVKNCWADTKVKIEKNFDFFWTSTKSAIELTRDVTNNRIEDIAEEIRPKVKKIVADIGHCKSDDSLDYYVSD